MQSTVTRAAQLESKGQLEAQAIVAQASLFPFVLVCFCSDRDSIDFPVLSCCCGSKRSSFVEISSSHWGGQSMTVRKERDGKRVRRRVGKQVKYGWKSFSQKRSPSVVARSGTAATARRQNVWTRSKCRRCQTKPPVLQGKHMQAVSTKRARS